MATRIYPRRDELPYIEPPARVVRFYRHSKNPSLGLLKVEIFARNNELGMWIMTDSEQVKPDGSPALLFRGSGVTEKTLAQEHREVYQSDNEVYEWMRFNLETLAQVYEMKMYKIGWIKVELATKE